MAVAAGSLTHKHAEALDGVLLDNIKVSVKPMGDFAANQDGTQTSSVLAKPIDEHYAQLRRGVCQ